MKTHHISKRFCGPFTSISYMIKDPPTTNHKQSVSLPGICWMKCTPLIPFVNFIPKKVYKKFSEHVSVRRFTAKKRMQNVPQARPLFSSPKGHLNLKVTASLTIPYFPFNPPSSIPSLPNLPPHNPSLPYGANGTVSPPQQFLQSSLGRVFLCSIHILPVVPVASRDGKPRDGDVAGPGGTLAAAVGEDFVFWG